MQTEQYLTGIYSILTNIIIIRLIILILFVNIFIIVITNLDLESTRFI